MDKTSSDDSHLTRPKFWEKQVHICEEKHLNKAIQQARANPDYKIKHPAECRGNPEGKTLTQCHPEAKIRILKELANKIKSVNPPPVIRPSRYNRS